ncbi:MAG: TauD/TfdA family dioxygenase [Pseudomonadota bacterium]|nr:TauD/TfdA family dioxygenase [Pseudomonadota bacterium]
MDIKNTTRDDYQRWAEKKLNSFQSSPEGLMVEIKDAGAITKSERLKIKDLLAQQNLVFYEFKIVKKSTPDALISFSKQLGLEDFDYNPRADKTGLTPITANANIDKQDEYVPFTTKGLNWHTDGYYNLPAESIHSWLLHCEEPAQEGGENEFLDHEIAYILFNQKNKKIINLMDDQAYTIPKNEKTGRKSISGYVFSFKNKYKKLHMRFTMRENNIQWNEKINKEINQLKEIIKESRKYHIRYKLDYKQGAITNNILHNRTSFTNINNQTRLIYRIRSKQRVNL